MADLRGRFRGLDQVRVPDLRKDIEDREPRGSVPEAASTRRRVIAATVAFALFAAAALLTWRAFAPDSSHGPVVASTLYRDPAGWSIDVPQGWRALPFDVSDPSDASLRFQGVQLSTARLPLPRVAPGTPPASTLRKDGVAVIVARAFGPPGDDEVALPLSLDAFAAGSALPGAPGPDTAYFAAGGWTFVATVSMGARADGDATVRTVERTVASFRFPQPATPACVSSQLSGRVAGSEGAAGTAFVTIALANSSTSACHLEGSPTVRMLSASGEALPVRERPGLPEGPSLEVSTVTLRPTEEASVVIAYTDVTVGSLPCLRARSLGIAPAGSGGQLEVPLETGAEVCGGKVWVAPFAALVGGS